MRQISQDWWIGLDDTYHSKADDGSLVFWRAERTVWINVWKDADGRTLRQRLQAWAADRDPDADDLFDEDDHGVLRFGYLLEEADDDGGRTLGLYSFTVGAESTVQMACYFELREDLDWATAVTKSLAYGAPSAGRTVDESLGEFGHLALASGRVLGPEGEPVLFAFREPGADDQDSGWRFFHGDEDEAYTADPRNTMLCPLASLLGLDPSLREIINSPPGSCWERPTPGDRWYPATGRPCHDWS